MNINNNRHNRAKVHAMFLCTPHDQPIKVKCSPFTTSVTYKLFGLSSYFAGSNRLQLHVSFHMHNYDLPAWVPQWRPYILIDAKYWWHGGWYAPKMSCQLPRHPGWYGSQRFIRAENESGCSAVVELCYHTLQYCCNMTKVGFGASLALGKSEKYLFTLASLILMVGVEPLIHLWCLYGQETTQNTTTIS